MVVSSTRPGGCQRAGGAFAVSPSELPIGLKAFSVPVSVHRYVRIPQSVKVEVAVTAFYAGQEDRHLIVTADEALVFQPAQQFSQSDGLIAAVHTGN